MASCYKPETVTCNTSLDPVRRSPVDVYKDNKPPTNPPLYHYVTGKLATYPPSLLYGADVCRCSSTLPFLFSLKDALK